VREGAGALELSESHPLEFVKFHRAAEVLRGGLGVPRQEKTTVHWYHGSTGTGKSRQAFEENEGAYWKDMSNGQWWDGYEQQECVVFDDMRKDTFKFHELLRLFDRYPLRIQVKGGYREFNSKKIIVTSCTTPDDMYATRCDEDMQQLLRRVEVIKHFSYLHIGIPVNRGTRNFTKRFGWPVESLSARLTINAMYTSLLQG